MSVFRARFRMLLQYRMAAWAGFGTQTFWGLVRIMIFAGFFASTTKTQPMPFEQVISYIWLGQALLVLIPFREDLEIAAMIRTGAIAYELVRPVNLYWFWFARQIANRTAPGILRALPMTLVAAGLLPALGFQTGALHAPASMQAFGYFFLALLVAVLLASTFSMLMTISLFWTVSAEGISNLFPVLIWSLCGIVIPIPFYPDWFQRILRFLPVRGIMDIPFQIYVGSIPTDAALQELGIQVAWIVILVAISYSWLKRGLRRVVVQGG